MVVGQFSVPCVFDAIRKLSYIFICSPSPAVLLNAYFAMFQIVPFKLLSSNIWISLPMSKSSNDTSSFHINGIRLRT